jgi:hypothetical protein
MSKFRVDIIDTLCYWSFSLYYATTIASDQSNNESHIPLISKHCFQASISLHFITTFDIFTSKTSKPNLKEMAESHIPVIDISHPSPEVAQQVLDAASNHGFLFIKNDGVTIPPKDINDMFSLVSIHYTRSLTSRLNAPFPLTELINQSQNPSSPHPSPKSKNMPSTPQRQEASIAAGSACPAKPSTPRPLTQKKPSTSDLHTQPYNPCHLHFPSPQN